MTDQPLQIRTVVGMEIHVQLATRTKLFCGCAVRYDAPANSCTCAVCLGHPGALPVLNAQAYRHAVLTGLALNCQIAQHTKWDRKSYYYPDLPKNYQISQYDLPLAAEGLFEIDTEEGPKRIRIRRVHLEEDAGKNIHDAGDFTLVDLNRAGTPLLEIVTEPDIASPEEAYVFCVELQRLIVHLGVSEANMQKGQMRFEPNINLVIETQRGEFRTPIAEVKNLNSFRSVRQAIEFETKRQLAAWQEDHDYQFGKRPNENRGWDADRSVTEFQRGKEAAHDYRYFPDPDLVPVELSSTQLDEIRTRLPELPVTRRRRFMQTYALSRKDAETLVDHRPTAELFERVISAGAPPDAAAKQFINVWLKLANDRSLSVDPGTPLPPWGRGQGEEISGRTQSVTDLGVDAANMAELAAIAADGTVNKSAANQLAEVMLTRRESPRTLAAELGLLQTQDLDATARWVDQAFAAHEQAVRDAATNPKKMQAAAGFLRGQVMKLSGGKADPNLVGKLIQQRLSSEKAGS